MLYNKHSTTDLSLCFQEVFSSINSYNICLRFLFYKYSIDRLLFSGIFLMDIVAQFPTKQKKNDSSGMMTLSLH